MCFLRAVLAISLVYASTLSAQGTEPLPTTQRSTPTFADIPWGSSRDAARKKLEEKGYRFKTQDKDGDLTFEGTVLATTTRVVCIFAGNRIVKTAVSLLTPDRRAIDTFREMRETLTRKYGPPRGSLEHFTSPYSEGDGYAEQAIRFGKGHFSAIWDGAGEGGLVLTISERLTVDVVYESEFWAAEVERRKARTTKAF